MVSAGVMPEGRLACPGQATAAGVVVADASGSSMDDDAGPVGGVVGAACRGVDALAVAPGQTQRLLLKRWYWCGC